MKLLTYMTLILILISSCGEKKAGKMRKIDYQNRLKKERLAQKAFSFTKVEGHHVQISLDGEGVIENAETLKSTKRFIRQKILHQVFENLRNLKDKAELEIREEDEFRFFPGEIHIAKKSKSASLINESSSGSANWKFDGEMTFRKSDEQLEIKDIVVGIGVSSDGGNNLNLLGQDVLRDKMGQIVRVVTSQMIPLHLSYSGISPHLVNELLDVNKNLFLEVLDLKTKSENLKEYNHRVRKNQSRIIISLPSEESLHFLENGKSVKDYLKQLDPELKFNFRGEIANFLSKIQDDMYSYPNQNIIDNIQAYQSKKFWWSNIQGSVENYLTNGRTIIFSYMSLGELRKSQYRWSKLDFKISNKKKLVDRFISGEIVKSSTEYSLHSKYVPVPLEIGTRECLEGGPDHKRQDCYIRWKASPFESVGHFKNQETRVDLDAPYKMGEVLIDGKAQTKFISLKKGDVLTLSEKNKIKNVNGGFVGWHKYDTRFNGYMIRSRYVDLSPAKLKQGHVNSYNFKGWELKYPF